MQNENLTRDEAARRSELISVQSYDVFLDFRAAEDPGSPGFASQSVISFSCRTPGSSTFIDFIGSGVHSVTLNGKSLDIQRVVSGARIALEDLAAENCVTVVGTGLYSRSGEGVHRFLDPADGRTYLYAQCEPADARRVFANFDQPDLKASYTFHVIAPSAWTVVSNAAEAARTELTDGSALSRWDFAPTERIPTYTTTVLAGPYFRAKDRWSRRLKDGTVLDIPLAVYGRLSLAPAFDTDSIFDLTKRGLDFYHDLFQYPYPFGKYDHAFVPECNFVAMENPGLVTATEAYVFGARATNAQYQGRANIVLHEMAHMWFGDLVTMSWWDDLWLKESFADYMATLALAEATQWRDAWVTFANSRKAWAYFQDQLPTTHPIVADVGDLEAAKQNFDGITYAKGAAVLKQLVAYVGFEFFVEAVRGYFRSHAFGNTSLQDLLSALSAATGRDLTSWAEHWLRTSGTSTLAMEVRADNGVITEAAIIQDAPDPVSGAQQFRPHRLKIGSYDFVGDRLTRTASIDMDVTGAHSSVAALAGTPRPALLLVNDEDLTYAKIRFDAVSLDTLRGHLSRLEDPLARALCWAALWNMTRDGVLSGQDYVEIVQRHGSAETDGGLLQSLLNNTYTAIENYAAPALRSGLRESHLRTAVETMQKAAPGSDEQLIWARAAAALGRHSSSQARYFSELLSGAESVEGLALDAELRWKFWHALSAHGWASEEELDSELAADNTAAGLAGYTRAMSARPNVEAKAAAWDSCVEESELSGVLLSAAIEGFNDGERELLAPYAAKYFDAIEHVWETRTIELAGRIAQGLFPGGQDLVPGTEPASHPVVLSTDAWLKRHEGAPAALRRIVAEQRDHLLRALTAQAGSAAEAGRAATPSYPEVTLMSDSRVQRIALGENAEPLVDVSALTGGRVKADYRLTKRGPERFLLREGLLARVQSAAETLPDGFSLAVVEGYRSKALQDQVYHRYLNGLRVEHPQWDEKDLRLTATRFASSPDGVAPHSTGGAVDLALIGPNGSQVDVGADVNDTPEESAGRCYTQADLPAFASENRAMLLEALTGAGLVNYPTEWWHWSYGEQYWAHVTGAVRTVYSPLEVDLNRFGRSNLVERA